MFSSVGVSEEQVFGDLYLAWLKDTGEKNTNDSRKLFREVMEKGFGERVLVLRRERLGANVAVSLAAMLHRSPIARLDLHGNTMRDGGCEMLSHLIRDLPNLLYLDLGANDIGPLGIQSLSFVVAGHKRLQTLILGSPAHGAYANRINAASATILLEGCLRSRSIRHLDISGCSMGERDPRRGLGGEGGMDVAPPRAGSSRAGSAAVRKSQYSNAVASTTGAAAANIRSASAAGNGGAGNGGGNGNTAGGGAGGNALDEGAGMKRPIDVLEELIVNSSTLATLKLREVQLTTQAALRIVYAAMQSSSLAYLDLSSNGLAGAVGDALGELIRGRTFSQNPSALHTVMLNDNALMRPGSGVPPPRLFSALSGDRVVTCLHLDSCGMDDEAISALCQALATNTALQSLHMRHNAITVDGAVELARALHRHVYLRDVSLEGNRIKNEGVCAFASMLESNNTLLSLNLAHTWMGERGIIALGVSLAENQALQRLNIAENHITEDAGEAFAALLENNRHLLRCGMHGIGVGHHTLLRIEKTTARNRMSYSNLEKDDLEKEVIRLHYQMYKLDEARTELDHLQTKKAEIGRAAESFELQFKQDQSDCAKKEREMSEMLENYLTQETHFLEEKKRLDSELERAHEEFIEDAELARERLEAESVMREKVEEEHRLVKAQLEDITNNGPQREEAKRQQMHEINEDRKKWATQRKEYRQAIIEAQANVNELAAKLGEGKGKKKGKGKKGGAK